MDNNNFFIYGDFDTRDYGLFVFKKNPYNAKRAKVKYSQRIGRNGVVFQNGKTFGASTQEYTCILLNTDNPIVTMEEIRSKLLATFNEETRLEDSYDRDVFYLGTINSDFSIKRNHMDKDFSFDVSFIVQPQRFLKSGQYEIFNPSEINNPTHNKAHPIVTFTTSDTAGSISFGLDSALSFSRLEVGTTVIFDADILDARSEDGSSLNEFIYIGNDVFLRSGLNTVMTHGVSDLKIAPRWWIF